MYLTRLWCAVPQSVDLFSYDYIFVPIHDYLHWSLAVVCNPGRIVVATEAGAARLPDARPCIIHLDSLPGAQNRSPPHPRLPLAAGSAVAVVVRVPRFGSRQAFWTLRATAELPLVAACPCSLIVFSSTA